MGYAGQSGSRADYQRYMKHYAGADAEKYAKNYATDYEKYMDRYSYTGNQAVENAHSAKDQKQLNAWKASQVSAVKQYVPVDFEHYAVQHINKQYQRRLNELQNEANQQTHAANAGVQQTLLLAAGADQDKAKHQSEADLRQRANETVKKVESLAESTKRAAHDKDAINAKAVLPAQKAHDTFKDQRSRLETQMGQLRAKLTQMKTSSSQDTKAEQAIKTRISGMKAHVEALQVAQLHALRKNTRLAESAVRHTARGVQDAARKAARDARVQTDMLARKYWKTEENLSENLDDRAEKAADAAEQHSEELARRTQDALERHADNVEIAMQKSAAASHEDEETRHLQSEDSEFSASKVLTFLAAVGDGSSESSWPVFTLAAVLCALMALALLVKRLTRPRWNAYQEQLLA